MIERVWGFKRAAAVLAIALVAVLGLNAGQASATHVSCGDTITQDTRLDSDLIDCPGIGVIIDAGGVTFDLNGHKIDGQGDGAGVLVTSDRENVTVQGGEISQMWAGVLTSFGGRSNAVRSLRLSDVSRIGALVVGPGAEIVDNSVSGSEHVGLWAQFADGAKVIGNTVAGDGTGIVVDHAQNAAVERNTLLSTGRGSSAFFPAGMFLGIVQSAHVAGNSVSGSPTGLFLTSSPNEAASLNNVVEKNDLALNDTAITIRTARDNTVRMNSLSRNGMGLLLLNSAQNRIEQNSIFGLGSVGISVSTENSVNNHLEKNFVSDQTLGILVSQAGDTNVIKNSVTGNGSDGLRVEFASGTLIEHNTANRNGDDGIDVRSPGNTLSQNTANYNADLGIEAVPGVIDGGGNRAFGNGNPLQCLNVACK